jgi:ABC-2 type transport system ATP-binding protein
MSPILSIAALTKKYASGLTALDSVDLTIDKGEIFALLGPNGAGKTTLIGVVCGIVSKTSGRVLVAGHDIAGEYRAARSKVARPLALGETRQPRRRAFRRNEKARDDRQGAQP